MDWYKVICIDNTPCGQHGRIIPAELTRYHIPENSRGYHKVVPATEYEIAIAILRGEVGDK